MVLSFDKLVLNNSFLITCLWLMRNWREKQTKARVLLQLCFKSSSKIKILTKRSTHCNNCLVSIHFRCKKDLWNLKKNTATAMRNKKKIGKQFQKNKAKSTPGLKKRNTLLTDSSFDTQVPCSRMYLGLSDFDSQALICKFSDEEGKQLFSVLFVCLFFLLFFKI